MTEPGPEPDFEFDELAATTAAGTAEGRGGADGGRGSLRLHQWSNSPGEDAWGESPGPRARVNAKALAILAAAILLPVGVIAGTIWFVTSGATLNTAPPRRPPADNAVPPNNGFGAWQPPTLTPLPGTTPSRTPGPTAPTAGPVPQTAQSSAAPTATATVPAQVQFPPLYNGSYPIGRTIYRDGALVVTLTVIKVSEGGRVTANVVYRNTSGSSILLSCGADTDPSVNRLTRSDGTVFAAKHSYCSDNPGTIIDLTPGASLASYAVFGDVYGRTSSFDFTWQAGGNISGSVSGITLGS